MALAATQMALDDAELDPAEQDPYVDERHHRQLVGRQRVRPAGDPGALGARGPSFVGAYQSIAWFYAATTGQISIRHGMKGPCGVVVSEGAGGLEALAALAPDDPPRASSTSSAAASRRRSARTRSPASCGNGQLSTRARPGGRLPAVRRARQRLRARRGRRDPAGRGRSTAPRERGRPADLRRDRRLRRDARRLPLRQAGARRHGSSRARCGWRSTTRGVGPDDVDVVFADARRHARGGRARRPRPSRRCSASAPPSAGDRSRRRWSAASTPAARRSTWPPRCSRCATASSRRRSTSTSRPRAAISTSSPAPRRRRT